MERNIILDNIFTQVDGVKPDKQLGKHQKMAVSPFLFFRGSAAVFYHDIASQVIQLPDSVADWPLTMITGDCHLSNFGLFSEEGSHGDHVIFAPNDFDDACIGHASWDILRFLVSLQLAAIDVDTHTLGSDFIYQAQSLFLSEYCQTLTHLVERKLAYTFVIDKVDKTYFLHRYFKKAKKRAAQGKKFSQKSALAKAVDLNAPELKFKDLPDKFRILDAAQYAELDAIFLPYMDDHILDIVLRLDAGTGSNNMDRYYLLVGPHRQNNFDNHSLYHIVEVKQQRQAAPIYYFPDLNPSNQLNPAHLTTVCQRRMQRNPDLVLDELHWQGAHWLVRSRHHAKVGIDPKDLLQGNVSANFIEYARMCAKVLALAHARADRRSTIFEHAVSESLKHLQSEFIFSASLYTEQVVADWQWLKQNIESE